MVTLRGCGQRLFVPSFEEKHDLRPFIISPTAIIRGVGITFQIPLIEVEGATGYYDSNLDGKAVKAAEAFKTGNYDFGFVHVKATDDAGHDKDHNIKVAQIEKCDKMVKTFIEAYGKEDCIICVTGDHSTPTCIGDHTNEPVPILISSLKNFEKVTKPELIDQVQKYDELACSQLSKSALGRFPCHQLIDLLKKVAES